MVFLTNQNDFIFCFSIDDSRTTISTKGRFTSIIDKELSDYDWNETVNSIMWGPIGTPDPVGPTAAWLPVGLDRLKRLDHGGRRNDALQQR